MTDRELGALLADVVADAKTARTLTSDVRRVCILATSAALVALAAAAVTDATTEDAGAEPLLTAHEVAARLHVATSCVRELIRTGALPSIKVGAKYVRVSPAALRQWMATQAAKPLVRRISSTYTAPRERKGASAPPQAARTDAGAIRRDARRAQELGRPAGTGRDRDQGIDRAPCPPARHHAEAPPAPDHASDETRW